MEVQESAPIVNDVVIDDPTKPIDPKGLQGLGEQVSRPVAVHGDDQAKAELDSRQPSLAALTAVADFAKEQLDNLQPVQGINFVGGARSTLAFVIRHCSTQAKLIGE